MDWRFSPTPTEEPLERKVGNKHDQSFVLVTTGGALSENKIGEEEEEEKEVEEEERKEEE